MLLGPKKEHRASVSLTVSFSSYSKSTSVDQPIWESSSRAFLSRATFLPIFSVQHSALVVGLLLEILKNEKIGR